jgi:hypothetical protein
MVQAPTLGFWANTAEQLPRRPLLLRQVVAVSRLFLLAMEPTHLRVGLDKWDARQFLEIPWRFAAHPIAAALADIRFVRVALFL